MREWKNHWAIKVTFLIIHLPIQIVGIRWPNFQAFWELQATTLIGWLNDWSHRWRIWQQRYRLWIRWKFNCGIAYSSSSWTRTAKLLNWILCTAGYSLRGSKQTENSVRRIYSFRVKSNLVAISCGKYEEIISDYNRSALNTQSG